uniref:Reverse transcriptase domain-containing protein n=1 Tax=Triticum urartu TaxID=4572 RepID=A0A8R7UNG8_TRIUA
MARGFPERWCTWMDLIFASSRSAVLLNGVPGKWFTVRRRLRQGDPCSPYLFLIVADVLQQMIRQDGGLFHPLVDGEPPLVLQYADDTLVILRTDSGAAARLRRILDDFAAATGLDINFV